MEKVNQVFYLVIFLVVFSLIANAYLQLKLREVNQKSDFYWIFALCLFAMYAFFYAIAPYVNYVVLTLAQIGLIASIFFIILLFRLWNTPIIKKSERFLMVMLIIYAICFEFFRVKDYYSFRVLMVIITAGFAVIWQIKELMITIRHDKSVNLVVIFFILIFQLLMLIIKLVLGNSLSTNLYDEDIYALAMRMVWTSSFLMMFLFINNYFYEKILFGEYRIKIELKEKKQELLIETEEKEKIAALLNEREELINHLILANKGATAGALTTSIAHEINQPLCAIRLNSEYLEYKLNNDSHDVLELRELVEQVKFDNQRAEKIILTLRNIFKTSGDRRELTDVNLLIDELILVTLPKLKNQGIELETHFLAGSLVNLNSSEFYQVLLNLINNAVDAFNGVTKINKKIRITTNQDQDYFYLSICDNGIGVPSEFQSSLFQLMKTTKETGMGVGLWLSKYIVERYNGTITHQKLTSGETEFMIRFPIVLETN